MRTTDEETRDIQPLRVDVALTPDFVPGGEDRDDVTYVVVDVVRATTTMCVAFEVGVRRLYVAGGIAEARAAKRRLDASYLLAGEAAGLAPEGFDLGNSPAEAARRGVEGATVIFATTNGTRALRACAHGRLALAGSLRNATAVMAAALAQVWTPRSNADAGATPAQGGDRSGASEAAVDGTTPDIVVVCAGRGGHPAYDDTLCAGWLVAECERLAAAAGRRVTLREGARIARTVAGHMESGEPLVEALASTDAGRAVTRVGLADDLAWCADVNTSRVVPRVVGTNGDGALVVIEATTMAPQGDSGATARDASGRAL